MNPQPVGELEPTMAEKTIYLSGEDPPRGFVLAAPPHHTIRVTVRHDAGGPHDERGALHLALAELDERRRCLSAASAAPLRVVANTTITYLPGRVVIDAIGGFIHATAGRVDLDVGDPAGFTTAGAAASADPFAGHLRFRPISEADFTEVVGVAFPVTAALSGTRVDDEASHPNAAWFAARRHQGGRDLVVAVGRLFDHAKGRTLEVFAGDHFDLEVDFTQVIWELVNKQQRGTPVVVWASPGAEELLEAIGLTAGSEARCRHANRVWTISLPAFAPSP